MNNPSNGSPMSLSEQAAREIMDMILVEKRFQAGDKLPNEIELAKELQISRVTLREAVRILITRGLLEIRRGKGTFVSSGSDESSSVNLSALQQIRMSKLDVFEIRLMCESTNAYYAAKRATKEEIERIEYLMERIEKNVAHGEDRLEAEQNFHTAIAMASHNPFLKELMPIVNRSIYSDLTQLKLYGRQEDIKHSMHLHRDIVRFIKAGNAEAARSAMELHILCAASWNGIDYE